MRQRLTLLVAATTSVVLIAFLVPIAVLTGDVAQASALRRGLAQSQSIVAAAGTGDEAALVAALDQVEADGLPATVFRIDGTSVGTPVRRDLDVEDTIVSVRPSVRDKDGGKVILQPIYGSQGPQVVRVEIPADELNEGVTRARTILLLLALVLFAGCVFVADRLARSLTRPLTAVGRAAERLGAGDLTTRVEPEGTDETREIARAMNRLATRIGELLTAEREQVADLSHRLRTPITALRLDAESVADPAERTRLLEDVDALTRQVDDVINEARRTEREGTRAACDVATVVAERVAVWQPLAEDQGRATTVCIDDSELTVRLTADDLAAAVDALLGNVMAHTPDGVALAVTVVPADGGDVLVVVEDAGPGLPHGDITRRGHSDAGSTGLGLDIVRRTAEASGGGVELDRSPSLGGARITMRLGPPTA